MSVQSHQQSAGSHMMEKQIPHSFCLAVKLGFISVDTCSDTNRQSSAENPTLIQNVPIQDIKAGVRGVVCYKCNYNYWFHFFI